MTSLCVQFVKKMGIVTEKSHVMVQPTILVMKKAPEGKTTVPATIQDKLNVGWLVKYFLIFDDNQVQNMKPYVYTVCASGQNAQM